MSFSLRRGSLPCVVALLLCCAPSRSDTVAARDAKSPQRKLAIRILVTEAPRQAPRPTQQRRGEQGGVAFPTQPIKVAERGKPIAARVYFQDCQPDSEGSCNVEVDLHGETSRGVRFGEGKGQVLWNKPAPKPGVSQAGTPFLRVVIEPSDPPGTYRILAVAHDRNSGNEAKAEATFEVK
jgi:hypothetical protein